MVAPKTAFESGVTLLAARERSRGQLGRLLARRGFAAEEVEAALERLQGLGYLDDARVARAHAGRLLQEGRARAQVAAKLDAEGLPPALVARAVAEQAEAQGHDEAQVAEALLLKRRLTGVKGARFLLSRGFDEGLVRRLVGLDDDAP